MQHKTLKPCSQTHKEQREKWENVPRGLKLFRLCRNDVICFYKTQFKFVPSFQELQQSASVETSCIPYFRTLECLLHQNPTNHSWEVPLPSSVSSAAPTSSTCVWSGSDLHSAASSRVITAAVL